MIAKDIQNALDKYYATGARYIVPNVYFFGAGYCETDLLVVKEPNGFIYDIEVKISRQDFKADFNKSDKHQILEHGTRSYQYPTYERQDGQTQMFEAGTPRPVSGRPNRFFFAVPELLISRSEVPAYAGLLYVSESGKVTKVKEAPVLHKNVIPVETVLCRKFYFSFRELRDYKENSGVNTLKNKINRLDRENNELQSRLLEKANDIFLLQVTNRKLTQDLYEANQKLIINGIL